MRTIADDIAAHAARHPQRVALSTPDGDVTYARLAARIEEIVRLLRGHGAGPETVCAVALEHGTDAVAAMAAVLRCGAAFLTLDVGQPRDRLVSFLRSADAALLLTCSALPPARDLGVPTVLLDEPEPTDGPPPGPVDPHALAYVSHTSGSTGEPSAVLIEHHALDTYLRDTARACGLGTGTVALQTAPLGYDASIRDTFVPLLAGARLVIVARSRLLRPQEFADTVREYGVTALLSVTPSFLSHLAGRPDLADPLAGVTLVASSGESLRPFLAAGGRAVVPGRLLNQYGPTECTMTTTRHSVPAPADPSADLVGTPRAGTVVRVLDADLAPVPDGTVGEVYIGGAGVARGYGGCPARTAACFVPDPLGPPGTRLYRTGDLGWWGTGGLHYAGRTDRQIKIRGYRVDPAEIEGALLAHPGVTGAVVTAHTDERGRTYLLAHVTGELAGTTDAELRTHLARSLPPHLMPRRFLRLDALPLTRGGKADRRSLTAGRTP
ncbi:amino acid adenylation domain-containing protein [Streptomyces broussonetiae]|uniref:Amino acid adenylation domain-containing protein n=1 Tax=Streptomyces broussonetiae TaxID=2686304 RepID=A0A6I6MSM6_9ACTN|nr:amino acid adenylation domain-containing protein [Streptomyces broussonetiae]QHA02482.1 amino acid adenylation domain-containing protein [Streptomyces broussonetiae]